MNYSSPGRVHSSNRTRTAQHPEPHRMVPRYLAARFDRAQHAGLVGLLAVMLLAKCAAAQPQTVKVTLLSDCEVVPAQAVTVRDVATIQGSGQAANQIGGVVLAMAPLPGHQRTIESKYVKLKLAAEARQVNMTFAGAESVRLTGKCARITTRQLSDEVVSFVRGQLPTDDRTYEVTVERKPKEVVLPANGTPEFAPRALMGGIKPGINTVAVDITVDGTRVATTSASVLVKAVASVMVASTAIRQGESITSSNTRWEQREVTRTPNALIQGLGHDVNDLVSRRSIPAGAVITSSDVTQPPAVRQGDNLALLVKVGNVAIHTTAQARQNGRVGETVRVRSDISQEDVRARIVEPGVVEINR